MIDKVVSYKQAMELLDSNYPQPKYEVGQYWYGKWEPGHLYQIVEQDLNGFTFKSIESGRLYEAIVQDENFLIFAPII
jgi:hypothetical protein